MFIATVDSSSESVGEPATICWNSVRMFRCNASTSALLGGITSAIVVTVAFMNGASWVYSSSAHALQPLGKDKQALVGHLDDFVHHRQRADHVQIGRLRRIHPRLALRHHDNRLVFAQRIDQLNRTFAAYRKWQHSMREQNRIPYRQHRQGARFRGIVPQFRRDTL